MKTRLVSSSRALWIPRILFFLLAPIFFLTLTLSLLAFDPAYYLSMQKGIGYPVTEETRVLDYKLAQFLWNGNGPEDITGFKQKEILHLYDIHNLLRLLVFATLVSGAVFLTSAMLLGFWDQNFRRILRWSFVFTLSFYFLTGTMLYFFFDWLFLEFHLFTFANDYWVLGEDYLLYRLFPPEFFQASLFPFFALLIFFTLLFYLLALMASKKARTALRAS
ncbi:MAG: DUF1461 domain-containing protein [bacterium]